MTTPNTTPLRTRNANLLDVTDTALSMDVRLQVWDDYTRDAEGDPVRLADVRLTIEQTADLIARLSASLLVATVNQRLAASTFAATRRVQS